MPKQPSNITEIRKRRREQLLLYLNVIDQNSHQTIGSIGDITIDGMMLLTKQPLTLQKDYHLFIEDSTASQTTRQIPFIAKCLWTKPDANPDYHCNGFSFVNPSQSLQDSIQNIIQALSFGDSSDVYDDQETDT